MLIDGSTCGLTIRLSFFALKSHSKANHQFVFMLCVLIIKLNFMLETPDLRFLTVVASSQSLAAAARALDITPPAVSQRLAQMERRLGLRLVDRGPRHLAMTADGARLVQNAVRVLDALSDLNEDVSAARGDVAGSVRVVAPFGFGRVHVAPVIADLVREYPKIEPDLVLSDDPYGAATTERWDVIIHIGQLADTTHVQRKLASNRRLLCAAPNYLAKHGKPKQPKDLHKHACGVIREDQADVTRWTFTSSDRSRETVRIRASFTSNDGEVVKGWCLNGMGIALRSEWSVGSELRRGQLVQVLENFTLPNADIIALLHPKALRNARVEKLIQSMLDVYANPEWRTND